MLLERRCLLEVWEILGGWCSGVVGGVNRVDFGRK